MVVNNPITNPTYEGIHATVTTTGHRLKNLNHNFDYIVGLSRGGLIPGVILSHVLETKFLSIDYSSTSGKGDNRNNHLNLLPNFDPTIKVLIVDDIIDSGRTMSEIHSHYSDVLETSPVVYGIYLRYTSIFLPDFSNYYINNDQWITFPWECK